MSHPPNHGNGCSLEDCHTNLFALVSAVFFFEMNNVKIPILSHCMQNEIPDKKVHIWFG